VKVQILPPQITLDYTEDFNDGLAQLFTGARQGTWSIAGGRYEAAPAADGLGWSVIDLGATLQTSSYLEMEARLRIGSPGEMGGVIFDRYADDDFKFVAIDAKGDRLIFGHVDPKRGLQIDHSIARTFDPGVEYALKLTMKGASVSVTVNGAAAGSWGYNSAVVDGEIGLFTKGGNSSFDSLRIRTNDPAFATSSTGSMTASSAIANPEADASRVVTLEQLEAIGVAAADLWIEALGAGDERLASLGGVQFSIVDLPGAELARVNGNIILVDIDAAGHGWYVDVSPATNEEFRIRIDENALAASRNSAAYGHIDLVTVAVHEMGHLLGFDHQDADAYTVMDHDLDPGVRYLLDALDFDGDADQPIDDATLLRLAEQAAAYEAAQARQNASRKLDSQRDSHQGLGTESMPLIDWQSRTASNWAMRLSPFDTHKPKGVSPDFAEFIGAAFDDEGEEGASEAIAFDSLGSALRGSQDAGDEREGAF